MKKLIAALALLVAIAIPAGVADAGKGKNKSLTHKGKVGISPQQPGESFVPSSGGSEIKLKFKRQGKGKGKRLTKLKFVDFEDVYYICEGGPDVISQGVRIGGAKVKKAGKNQPPGFRYFEKGDGFLTTGIFDAEKFKFDFRGEILDGTKRATGTLRSEFSSRTYGECSTGSQVWRSES